MWNRLYKWEKRLFVVNTIVILVSTAYYIATANFEFLIYIVVVLLAGALLLTTARRSNFPPSILWGLSIWNWMHMGGGSIPVGDNVLYKWILIPLVGGPGEEFTILKYDQIVHFFGFAVATLLVAHLIKPYLNEKTNWKVVMTIIVLAGMGLGTVNELVEFLAVIIIPETGVGGYYNTSLDMVSNALGGIAAAFYLYTRRKRVETASS